MDTEAAKILAAALNNIAAASALQAESNMFVAGKFDELTNVIRGAQMMVDRKLKPSIDRSKAFAAEMVEKARVSALGQ